MNRPFRKSVVLFAALISLLYLVYRIGFSMNLATTYSAVVSILLVVGEAFGIVSILLYFVQIWDPKEPPMKPVLPDRSVDVFVPTYNEDIMILRATLEACIRLDYPHRTYLCDDGGTEQRCNDRDETKAQQARDRKASLLRLCAELGVTYLTRPANVHAKAGNLNEAFAKTDGEFIIIFDADHVPERHFITRLIGYFGDDRLGYVQTPHAFYNFESFQARLDHKNRRYWEEGALFYGLIQPGRNRWGCPIFAGSAAMFRRKAMEEVGYIATETITEDMHTGMRINAKGWKSLAISERMVAGQAAPDITTFHSQRLRWGEGNLSIMAHDFPLTMKGLTFGQRMCYLGSMVHWAGGLFKLLIFISPILMMLTGVPPVKALNLELLVITIVYLLASVFGVLYVSNGFGSIIYGELFCMVNFWTQIRATCRALFLRKFQRFVVTSKRGRQSTSVWPFVRPHIILAIVSIIALSWGWSRIIFGVSDDYLKPLIPSFWICFHLWLISMVVTRAIWPLDRRYSYRHMVNLHVEFEGEEDQKVIIPSGAGVTIDINELGFSFIAYDIIPEGSLLKFKIYSGTETVAGSARLVSRSAIVSGSPQITFTGYRYGVAFNELPIPVIDAINRIALQYAVPRLYREYEAGNRKASKPRLWRWAALKMSDQRVEPRRPYRFPICLEKGEGSRIHAVTEDISLRAMVVLLEQDLAEGTILPYSMHSPIGLIEGKVRVYRTTPQRIAHHSLYRAVLWSADFAYDGQRKLLDLLGHRRTVTFSDVVTPEKKPLRVRTLRPVSVASVAIVLLIALQQSTFPIVYRDELFLRRLMTASGAPSADELTRYERIYADTMAQSYPSNDRLVLLMNCLPKLSTFEGRDELTRFLAARDRNNIDLQLALAGTLDKTQDYSQAEAEFKRLFELDKQGRLPESRRRDLLLASARSAIHRGDVGTADERFNMYLTTYPDQGVVRNEYAGVMIQAGRYHEVPKLYEKSNPDYDGHLMLMSAYALNKDFDKAEAESRKLLELRPEDPKAGRLLADLLTYRKNYQQSKDLYDRLLKDNPNDPEIRVKLGQIHLANNHYDEAATEFQLLMDQGYNRKEVTHGFLDACASATFLSARNKEAARQLYDVMLADSDPDPVYLARLGWVLERSKDTARSLELVRRSSQIRPNDKDIQKQYFGLLVSSGRMNEALTILGANRTDPNVRRLLTDVYLRSGDFAAANLELSALIESQPDDLKLQRLQADVLSWNKEYSAGLAAFERLRKLNPGDESIPLRIAEVTHWSGNATAAITLFQELLDEKFDRPDVWRGFVDVAADVKSLTPAQFRHCVRISEQPSTRASANATFLTRLAWVFIREKQQDFATPLLQRAQSLPLTTISRRELAGVLASADLHREALALYSASDPETDVHLLLASIHIALSDFALAEKSCREYLKEKPGDAKAERLLADVLSWKKDYPQSMALLKKLIRLYPEDQELPVRLAEVTLWSGNHKEALGLFQSMLTKRPTDVRVANGFIDCCNASDAISTPQYESILKLVGTGAYPITEAAAITKLAWASFKAGDKAESEKRLMAAVQLKPADPATRKQIGLLHLAMDRATDAMIWFEGITLDFDDRLMLAHAHASAKLFDRAEEHLAEALRLRPDDQKAERILADVRSRKGDHKGALLILRQLQKKTPVDAELAIRVAETTLWSGEPAAAIWLIQELLEKKYDQPRLWSAFIDAAAVAPKLTAVQMQLAMRIHESTKGSEAIGADMLSRLAWIMYQAGRTADSAALIDRALARNPSEPNLRREIAGICALHGKILQALNLYDGLDLHDDDRERLVGLYASAKDLVSAEKTAKLLVEAKPDEPKYKQLLADVFSEKGDHKAALDLYRELRSARPADESLELRQAAILQAAGDAPAALAIYQKRLENRFDLPDLWKAWIGAAASLERVTPEQGKLAQRIAATPITMSSEDPIYLARLALVLQRANCPQSKPLLDRATKLEPKDPTTRRELARILVSANRTDQALAFYQGLDLNGEDLLAMAGLKAAQRDFSTALKYCREYLAARPADPEGERLQADLLSWSGRHDEAIVEFDRLRKLRPTDPTLPLRAAETVLWSGRAAEALGRLTPILEKEPNHPLASAIFVACAFELPSLSSNQQLTFDRIAREIIPTNNDPIVLGKAIVILHRLGRTAEIDRLIERAISLTPTQGPTRRLIGGYFALAGRENRATLLWSGLSFDADGCLDLARLFLSGRDSKAAIRECQAILLRVPDHRAAQRLLADVLAFDKKYSDALALLKKLQSSAMDDPDLSIRIAEMTLAAGDTISALELFQKELERNPNRPKVWTGFVDAAAASRALTPTQQAFVIRSYDSTSLKESSDPAFLTRFAWLMHLSGKSAEASSLASKALALKPEDPSIRKNLGGVFLALGNDKLAAQMYEGLRLDAEDQLQLVNIHNSQKDFTTAEKQARALLAASPDDRRLQRMLADILSWKKDYSGSLSLFAKLRSAAPDDLDLKTRHAEVKLWSGDRAGAAEEFRSMLQSNPQNTVWRMGFIDAVSGLSPIGPNDAVLAEQIARAPGPIKDPLALGRLALILHRGGKKELAAELTEKLKPSEPEARKELAGILASLGRHQQALDLFNGLTWTNEDRIVRIGILAGLNDLEGAEKAARELVVSMDRSPKALKQLAEVLTWRKDMKGAAEVYIQLASLTPDDPDLAVRSAEMMVWLGDYKAAVTRFESLLTKEFRQPGLWPLYFAILANLPEISPTQQSLAERIIADPAIRDVTDVTYLSNVAWVLNRIGKRAEGEPFLDRAIAQKPVEPSARKVLAGILDVFGRSKEALQMFEGLSLDSGDRLQLAGLYASGRQYDLAEKQVRAALSQEPKNRKANRMLADILSWKGNYAESLAEFAKQAAEFPDDRDIPDRIAEVLLWSRDYEKATIAFQSILEADFNRPSLWGGFIDAAASSPKLTRKNVETAASILDRVKDESRSLTFWCRMAWILGRFGDQDRQKVAIDRAQALNPQEPSAKKELAASLSAFGKHKEALALYQGLGLEAEDHLRLAGIHAALKNFEAAEEHVRLAQKLQPKDFNTRHLMADVLSWSKQYKESIRVYEELLTVSPDNQLIQGKLANVLLWDGQFDESATRHMLLLEKELEQSDLWGSFLDAIAGARSIDQAKYRSIVNKLHDKILQMKSPDTTLLKQLGTAMTKVGEPAKGLGVLRRALDANPRSREVKLRLATALSETGQFAEAEALFRSMLNER